VKPVGANRRVRTDVRIIAATNRDLEKEVQAGNFREDLYYRLAVIKVELPPLRKRVEDIPVLVNHFVKQFSPKGAPIEISYDTMRKLAAFPWTGNVRELRNFVERAALLTDTGRIETRFVRAPTSRKAEEPEGDARDASGLPVDYDLPFKDAKSRLVDAFEQAYWTRQLSSSGGNISEAARRGGIHRKSLEYLLKKLDIAAKELAHERN
jgi:DNA-binding NtrC family response regulator